MRQQEHHERQVAAQDASRSLKRGLRGPRHPPAGRVVVGGSKGRGKGLTAACCVQIGEFWRSVPLVLRVERRVSGGADGVAVGGALRSLRLKAQG